MGNGQTEFWWNKELGNLNPGEKGNWWFEHWGQFAQEEMGTEEIKHQENRHWEEGKLGSVSTVQIG